MKRFVITLFVLVIVAGAAAALIRERVVTAYRGYSGTEQFVDIPAGTSTRAIGQRLVAAGVIPDPVTFRVALWLSGRARALKAGEYRFDQPLTPMDVIDKLARGDVYVINVTFPEGRTISEMAEIFESHGLGAASTFIEAAKDVSAVSSFAPA